MSADLFVAMLQLIMRGRRRPLFSSPRQPVGCTGPRLGRKDYVRANARNPKSFFLPGYAAGAKPGQRLGSRAT